MLFQLDKESYEIVRLLFKEMRRDVSADAVLDGNSPGTVWVDNKKNPTAALMDSPEGYILVGDPSDRQFSNAINKLFVEEIYPTGLKTGKKSFEIHCKGTWEDRIQEVILKGKLPIKIPCQHFLFREIRIPDWKDRLPEGFEMLRVDEKFLSRSNLKGFEEVISRVCEWGSPGDFLEKGFGFRAVRGDEIVSRCIADCVSRNRCEIGIGTSSKYRKRGFASLTATAAVEYCLDNGLTAIGWHCARANKASRMAALAVGFEKIEDYHVYSACFNEFENYIQNALYKIYELKEPAGAEKYLEKAFAMERPGSDLLYVLARAYAVNDFRDLASKYIEAAVASGFDDYRLLADEDAFDFLKTSDRWKTLLSQGK